jgi:hypothetical protein
VHPTGEPAAFTAGQNIGHFRSEAAFAKICGAAPIQASSGRTTRHRLDFGATAKQTGPYT